MSDKPFILGLNDPELKFSIVDVMCPSCLKDFRLEWNNPSAYPNTLVLYRTGEREEVTKITIKCPHCGREDELE